jgi:hypothetical protein
MWKTLYSIIVSTCRVSASPSQLHRERWLFQTIAPIINNNASVARYTESLSTYALCVCVHMLCVCSYYPSWGTSVAIDYTYFVMIMIVKGLGKLRPSEYNNK